MIHLIKLTVIPGSKKNIITKIQDDVYEVKLKAPAQKNQANKLLIAALAEYFELPTNKIKIISGHHSHHKRVEINQ